MTESWPNIKRGNPYRHSVTLGFASGSIADVRAALMIKSSTNKTDAQAQLIATTDPAPASLSALNTFIGLTLAAGSAPNTVDVTLDFPDERTAVLSAKRLPIGLQFFLPNGDTIEVGEDEDGQPLLAPTVLVLADVVHATA